MTTLSGNPTPNQDDLLADFADRALTDGSVQLEFSADKELRSLEETLLRLHRAFSRETMNEDTVKRMQADFRIRKRRQAAQEQAGHQTWFSSLFQSPVAMAVATFIVIGVFAFLASSLTTSDPSMSGTAGTQTQPTGFLLILGVIVILLALWLGRRK